MLQNHRKRIFGICAHFLFCTQESGSSIIANMNSQWPQGLMLEQDFVTKEEEAKLIHVFGQYVDIESARARKSVSEKKVFKVVLSFFVFMCFPLHLLCRSFRKRSNHTFFARY